MAEQEVSDRNDAPVEEADEATGSDAATRAQLAELEDRWRRAVADLDNFRKRVTRDSDQLQRAERARVAADWLPVLDNLELALQHAESDPGTIVEGVRAVREQALAVLNRLGYPRRDDVGEPFDPTLHEAVGTIEDSEVPDGTVVKVVRPGYGSDENLLRPAAVVVAKRPN
jgi:molecular chaperone GrpE